MSTWTPTSSWMGTFGISATTAPTTSSAVNRPRKMGAADVHHEGIHDVALGQDSPARRRMRRRAARLQVSQHESPSPPVRRLDLVLRNGGRLPGATPDEQTADGRVVARGEVDGDV